MTVFRSLLACLCFAAWAGPVCAQESAPSSPPVLRQIAIAESVEAAQQLAPIPGGGFLAMPPTWAGKIDGAELHKRLANAENRPVNEQLLIAVAQVIEAFLRNSGLPSATVIIPEQRITDGLLRVAALPDNTSVLLKRIVVADSIDGAKTLPPPGSAGFLTLPASLAQVDRKELEKRLAGAADRIVDDRLLASIAQVVETFLRQNDFPLATVQIPDRRLDGGTLRLAVLLGKFREIRIRGNRWFSESLLRNKLDIQSGEVIRISDLERAINWTNASAFRKIRAHIDPIPNTNEANLIIGVDERLPLRLTASLDNGGNEAIGEKRGIAGITYGNMWGLDHDLSYQFVTTDKYPVYRGHGLNYRAPLPWKHTVHASVSYSRARPEFYDGLFVQDGENLNADLRYSAVLRRGENPVEGFLGLNFKQSNNNLEFGGSEVQSSKADTFQFTAGVSGMRRDRHGGWILSLSLNGSPGNLNSRNTDSVYGNVRIGANPAYVYGNLSLQRVLALGKGWELNARGVLQKSSTNLLSNEQLSIGGAATVRGFTENTYIGDEGFVASTEVATPYFKRKLPFVSAARPPIDYRWLAFFDTAHVKRKHVLPIDRTFDPLASVGFGLRASLPPHLQLTADYGYQLARVPFAEGRGRLHVKLLFSY